MMEMYEASVSGDAKGMDVLSSVLLQPALGKIMPDNSENSEDSSQLDLWLMLADCMVERVRVGQ